MTKLELAAPAAIFMRTLSVADSGLGEDKTTYLQRVPCDRDGLAPTMGACGAYDLECDH